MRKLALTILVLLMVGISPVSWAGELEDAQEAVRQNPNYANAYYWLGRTQYSIANFIEKAKKNIVLIEATE